MIPPEVAVSRRPQRRRALRDGRTDDEVSDEWAPDYVAFVSCPPCSTSDRGGQGCAATSLALGSASQGAHLAAGPARMMAASLTASNRQTVTGRFPVWASASRPAQAVERRRQAVRCWAAAGVSRLGLPGVAPPSRRGGAGRLRCAGALRLGCGYLGGGGAAEGGDPSFDPGIHGPR